MATKNTKQKGNGKMRILSANEILEADDIQYEIVDVPEWGGAVRLKTMDTATAMAFGAASEGEKAQLLPRMLALSAVDEGGELLFSEAAVEKLARRSFRALNRLQDAMMEINGLKEMAAAEASKNA